MHSTAHAKLDCDSKSKIDLQTFKSAWELSKPGVMSLSIASAIVGIILAPGEINHYKLFWALICIILGAGSAGAINMCLEIDVDSKMTRTSKRPLPMKKIDSKVALDVSIAIAGISVFFAALFVNFLTSFLLFLTIIFYGYLYTAILKKKTIYNVVIGGIPGALPPIIGWTAVTNSISFGALTFFLIIFLWIPPHSWALALYKTKEYQNANIPMLPVVKGRRYTINQIIFYSILLIAASYTPLFFNDLGLLYLAINTVCNAFFIYFLIRLFKNEDPDNHIWDKKLFIFSINHLFILFIAALFDYYL
jgi:protoheme IX farnesyltransferase